MEVRGAAEIARQAARALCEEAREYDGDDAAGMRQRLLAAREVLLAPDPPPYRCGMAFSSSSRNEPPDGREELRRTVIGNAKTFIKRSEEAVTLIGRNGANRLKEGTA